MRVAREPELLIRVASTSGSWSLKAPELWRAQLRTLLVDFKFTRSLHDGVANRASSNLFWTVPKLVHDFVQVFIDVLVVRCRVDRLATRLRC